MTADAPGREFTTKLVVTADDFGSAIAVNEAVERGYFASGDVRDSDRMAA